MKKSTRSVYLEKNSTGFFLRTYLSILVPLPNVLEASAEKSINAELRTLQSSNANCVMASSKHWLIKGSMKFRRVESRKSLLRILMAWIRNSISECSQKPINYFTKDSLLYAFSRAPTRLGKPADLLKMFFNSFF